MRYVVIIISLSFIIKETEMLIYLWLKQEEESGYREGSHNANLRFKI